MDDNDGGSLESGHGSGLGHCGHRREACLAHGFGAEGHPQSVQRCITVSKYIKDMSEKDKSLAEIRRGTTTNVFSNCVVKVHDPSSPAHDAQEEIS